MAHNPPRLIVGPRGYPGIVEIRNEVITASLEVEADRAEVAANAATVATLASQVEGSTTAIQVTALRDEVEADRVEVAANTATVAANTAAVEADRAEVATNRTAVAADAATVATARVEVETNRAQVATNTAAVAANTTAVATNTAAVANNTTAAANSAATAVSARDATEAKRAEVAANAATVAANTAAVEADRAEVETNTATVTTNTSAIVLVRNEVEASRTQVATNTATVVAARDAVEADRVEVADNVSTVIVARDAVEADRLEVANNTASVTAMRNEVETDRVEVAANRAAVSVDRSAVATDRTAVASHLSTVLFARDQVEADRAEVEGNTAACQSYRDQVEADRLEILGYSATFEQNSLDLTTKASKGVNTDITALQGLTTPLSELQGGTGATAFKTALANVPSVDFLATLNASARPPALLPQARANELYLSALAPAFNGVNPGRHLRMLAATQTPIVVIVGDSLSTPFADALAERDTLWGMIKRKLREENPTKTFTFYNRGVGAQTFTNINGVPNVIPANITWYTDPARPWLEYVEELQPDVLILASGMNDKYNFVSEQFRAIFESKIAAWAKRPDIVLATNAAPTNEAGATGGFEELEQWGRDYVAGYVRTYAQQASYGLLDFNRAFRVIRDGIDPVQTALEEVVLSQATTLPYAATSHPALDFQLTAAFTAVPVGFWDPRGDGTTPIEINLSGNLNNVVHLSRDTGTGNVRVKVFKGQANYLTYSPPSAFLVDTVTNVPAPTSGDVTIFAEVQGAVVRLLVNDAVVYEGLVARYGGTFTPRIAYATEPGDVTRAATITLRVGRELVRSRRLITQDMFAAYDGNANSTKKPYGGNGFNHLSSIGARFVYGYVLDNTSFASGNISHGSNGRVGFGTGDPKAKRIHSYFGPSGVTADADANDVIVESNTSHGASFVGPNTSAARLKFGDPENSAQCTIVYDHTTDVFSVLIGGNTVCSFTSTRSAMVGGVSLATSATDGFVYVPSMGGKPTANPTTQTGRNPIVVDTVNNRLRFFSGGSWRYLQGVADGT